MNAINELSKVYCMLEDDKSKDIFLLRLKYAISKDPYCIKEIVDKYVPNRKWLFDRVSDLIHSITDEIIIYGAGNLSRENFWRFREEGAKVFAFCDANKKLQESGLFGLPVLAPEELPEHTKKVVILSTWCSNDEMRKIVLNSGFAENHIFEMPHRIEEAEMQYFDPEIVRFGSDEVFVDDGCYNIDTTLRFVRKCDTYKKIYAFEPDKGAFDNCIKRIKEDNLKKVEMLPYGTWSEKTIFQFEASGDGGSRILSGKEETSTTIHTCVLDDVIGPDDKVTFLKMDIEGAELESLKGARRIIKRDKPKLAVCIYHKPEDIVEIPLFIKELVPEYRLFIRHYSDDFTETVLYAVL